MLLLLRSLIIKNFWTKSAAAAVAVFCYLSLQSMIQKTRPFEFALVERGIEVNKNLILVPEMKDLILIPERRDEPVVIEFTGAAQDIERMRGKKLVGEIPSSTFRDRLEEGAPSGRVTVRLNDIEFPDDLREVSKTLVGRKGILFQVSRRKTRQLRVIVDLLDQNVQQGYEVGEVSLTPSHVEVSGPESWFESKEAISLEPVEIPSRTDMYRTTAKLPPDLAALGIRLEEPVVVAVRIRQTEVERTHRLKVNFLMDSAVRIPPNLAGLELRQIFSLEGNRGYDRSTDTMEVTLVGPPDVFELPHTKSLLAEEPLLFIKIKAVDFNGAETFRRYLHTSNELPPELHLKKGPTASVDVTRRTEVGEDSAAREGRHP